MKVLLDLRPPKIVQEQKKRINPLRLVMALLFVVFTALSLFNVGYMYFQLDAMNNELGVETNAKDSIQSTVLRLDSELTKLRDTAKAFNDYLVFTKSDIPVVEVLAALEAITPQNLKIESFTLNPGAAAMVGVGLEDTDVVQFAQNLEQIPGIISKVNPPITSKRTVGNRLAVQFNMTAMVNDLGTIFANNKKEAEAALNANSGDQQEEVKP